MLARHRGQRKKKYIHIIITIIMIKQNLKLKNEGVKKMLEIPAIIQSYLGHNVLICSFIFHSASFFFNECALYFFLFSFRTLRYKHHILFCIYLSDDYFLFLCSSIESLDIFYSRVAREHSTLEQ